MIRPREVEGRGKSHPPGGELRGDRQPSEPSSLPAPGEAGAKASLSALMRALGHEFSYALFVQPGTLNGRLKSPLALRVLARVRNSACLPQPGEPVM